ncbi:MAG: hypothetical protein COV59_00995 [Candidatus Magasanikbacteria bacterium CG11_big_fil_rev_8_21_14_0_20_39_34]|uniref:Uncharacterized protein n=1 Tax=Candidatus Magasanikbacteria bacterium CG11_big_fil_rev_8_21_14_0_20_39_34 TaxID=1974653 RepID=A0A2H0N6A1_9BACT|nr:MAG: hypothetical protein COV59_00995 [Candidatus Magasanikbacteria bacterium CG11_big_fil_rev_8_21_14_0_20_39_34]
MFHNKFSEYKDPSGEFTNAELQAATWYVRHKLLLQKIGLSLLIFFCLVTGIYGVGGFAVYFLSGYFQDKTNLQLQVAEIQSFSTLHDKIVVENLRIRPAEIYSHTQDRYDFLAQVTNPNKKQIARITYRFVYNGGATEVSQAVLPPGAERFITFFGHQEDFFPFGERLEIQKVEWRRVDPHDIPDAIEYTKARDTFSLSDFHFVQAGTQGSGLQNNSIRFSVTNETAYSFYEAEFYVKLLNGEQLVGILPLYIDNFRSFEIKELDLRFGTGISSVSDIEVVPTTNVFDGSVYMKIDL